MDAAVAGEALEDRGVAPELGRRLLLLDGLLQLGILVDSTLFHLPLLGAGGEGDVEFVRDHLGDAVGVAIAPAKDAADIAHDALRA